MVSFRYHVVSIVAVFLAIGLGILMGTTVVRQGVVEELRKRADGAVRTTHSLQKDVTDLRRQLQALNNVAPELQHLLVTGELAGRAVVLVTSEGVDFSEVDGVRKVLGDSGADVSGVLVMTSRMALTDDGLRQRLAGVLGLSGASDQAELSRQAAEALALRLAGGAPPDVKTADLIDQLAQAQFLQKQFVASGGVQQLGGPDQPVVVLGGSRGKPAVDPAAFFVPLIDSLVESNHPVAVAETFDTSYDFVSLVRKDGSADGRVLTVDDADQMPGRVALVLGLRNILDSGAGGCQDFGVKPDACGSIPTPAATP